MSNKEEYQRLINDPATNPALKQLAETKLYNLQMLEKSAEGDKTAPLILALAEAMEKMQPVTLTSAVGTSVSKEEVEKLVKDALKKGKIKYDDLSDELKDKLNGMVKVTLNLTTNTYTANVSGGLTLDEVNDPLFQKIVSDVVAQNNIYLYGSAGTGKTFTSEKLAKFLGWTFVEVNCNQFTSPLDLIGGQTIDGYQKGKLEIAWSNVDENSKNLEGAVLCLDELPKLDPNTAGLLNSALAKIKLSNATIRNGRGQTISKGKLVIIGTGNTRLNETNLEYEANFKQDLSLQDRFVGSCYEVMFNYRLEYTDIMKDFLFIWIYMIKMREVIIAERYTSKAFVSMRILISMRDSYRVYREWLSSPDETVEGLKMSSPKTLKESLDSFLNLFNPNQIVVLKEKTKYDDFIQLIETKNKIAKWQKGGLNTESEIKAGAKLVADYDDYIKSKLS
jgi:cobaltochelatase CobS